MSGFRRMLTCPRVAGVRPLGKPPELTTSMRSVLDLDKDVGTLEEPVAVHDRVGDGLPQRLHRVVWDVLPPQTL